MMESLGALTSSFSAPLHRIKKEAIYKVGLGNNFEVKQVSSKDFVFNSKIFCESIPALLKQSCLNERQKCFHDVAFFKKKRKISLKL